MKNILARNILPWFIFSTLLSVSGCSSTSPESLVPPFQKNDTVVFIGDSITHGGSYHKNIFLYYATRFPNREFKYYNAGISGDTTVGTFDRFETDIAIHKPTVATIMLGMNDVSSDLYRDIPTEPKAIEKRNKSINEARLRYVAHMDKLINALLAINSKVILIKPSIYDQTADLAIENKFGTNDQLIVYGNEVAQLAKQYNLPIVDFQTPLIAMNKQLQDLNKAATIIGQDRVHPGEEGHLVMAHAFMKAQGLTNAVTHFSLDANSEKQTIENCKLSDQVSITTTKISFSCTASALPFPVNDAQDKTSELLPFQQDFNQQTLITANLVTGNYEINIDGERIATYSAKQLSKGVNLATIKSTPMYQQALAIKELNDKRAQLSAQLRGIALIRYSMLSKYPEVNLQNKADVSKTLYAHVEKSAGKPWYNYLKTQVEKYLENVGNKEEIRAEINSLYKQIFMKNKPKNHYWNIQKI